MNTYSCAGHLVPYVAAVKNPYPVTSLYVLRPAVLIRNKAQHAAVLQQMCVKRVLQGGGQVFTKIVCLQSLDNKIRASEFVN